MTELQLYKKVEESAKICHCSKYEPPKRLNPRWGMDYSLRPVKKDTEERCTRCGRLFRKSREC